MDKDIVKVLLVDDDEDDYVLTRDWFSRCRQLSINFNG